MRYISEYIDRTCYGLLVIAMWVIQDPMVVKIAITVLVVEAMFVRSRLKK